MTKVLGFIKEKPAFFLWSLLSGILVGTSYIPFPGWALFFCYIPLWLAVQSEIQKNTSSLAKIFAGGWLAQFVLTLIGFNWIYYVSSEFGHLPWYLSLGALLMFAGFMHLYIPLSLLLSALFIRRFRIDGATPQFFILALTLAVLERAWPSIFEWNLAYTLLWIRWPMFQWADTVGFWGLSTWIFLLQATLCIAIYHRRSDRKYAITLAGSVIAIMALLNISGHFKGQQWSRGDAQARIAVAQGNIGNAEKIQSEQRYHYHSYIRSIYTVLTTDHLKEQPADLMIWPETAVPFALDPHFHSRLEQTNLLGSVQEWGIPLITGGYSVSDRQLDHLGYSLTRNAVFYLAPNRSFSDLPYYKTNLLAFGEYMPFGEEFPILYKLLPFVGVYEKGSGPVVATVKLPPTKLPPTKLPPTATQTERILKVGPQICYDSLAPGFTRRLALNGAQVIFNVTNDSWFGWWAEPYQHGWMTLARAIEVRRPLVRSTNTGISTAILADGRVLEQSPINKTWAHTFDISYRQQAPQTFYTRLGHLDWIIWSLTLALIIFIYRKKGPHVRS